MPFRVLVVDDDSLHLSNLDRILNIFGYEVVNCTSHVEASVALGRNEHKIDIMVCGLLMSDKDAFTLVRIAEFQLNIPVVLLVSNPRNEDAFRWILGGVVQCVAKPVVDDLTLRDIWQHVVRRRRQEYISKLFSLRRQCQINDSLIRVPSETSRETAGVVAHRGGPSFSNPNVARMIELEECHESSRRETASVVAHRGGPSCSNPNVARMIELEEYRGSSRRETAGVVAHRGGPSCSNPNVARMIELEEYRGSSRRETAGVVAHRGGPSCSNPNVARMIEECRGSSRREIAGVVAHRGGPSYSNPNVARMIEECRGSSGHDHHLDPDNPRKPRFVWSDELHQVFLDAVKYLNQSEKIVPKTILDYMRSRGVSNISRENVASHLQKYRLYHKKSSNNAIDQSSIETFLLTSPNVTEEVSSGVRDFSSTSPTTSRRPSQILVKEEKMDDLPSQNLIITQDPPPPNPQPSNELTPSSSFDQNNDINWDDLKGLSFDPILPTTSDLEGSMLCVMESYEPRPILPQQENDASLYFSQFFDNELDQILGDNIHNHIVPYHLKNFENNPFEDRLLNYRNSTSSTRKRSLLEVDGGIEPKTPNNG